MKVKANPFLDKGYYKAANHLMISTDTTDYVANIAKSIELTPEATSRLLNRMVKDNIIPAPSKVKLLNKTLYSWDWDHFLKYVFKEIKTTPKHLDLQDFIIICKEFANQSERHKTVFTSTLLGFLKQALFIYTLAANKSTKIEDINKNNFYQRFFVLTDKFDGEQLYRFYLESIIIDKSL